MKHQAAPGKGWVGLWAPLLVTTLTLLVGCGGPSEINFGAILDESGEAAAYGRSVRRGIELAAEQINAEGVESFPKAKITVSFKDSGGKPDLARAAFTELVETERVRAVIGGATSTVTLSLCPLAEEAERLLLSPAASSPQISNCGSYVARIYPSDVLEAGKMVDFARKKLFIKRLSLIALQNDYGLGLKKEFVQSFRKLDGEIIEIVNYNETETDFKDEVDQALQGDVQGVYLIGYTSHLKALAEELHARKPQSSDGRPVRILSCGAFDSQQMLTACPAVNGLVFPRPSFDPSDTAPKVQEFVAAYRAKYGEDPDSFAAHGYDALQLLVDAVDSRGSLYPGDLQQYVITLQNWEGVTGTTTMDPKGDVSTRFPRIFVVKDCAFEDFEKLVASQGGE